MIVDYRVVVIKFCIHVFHCSVLDYFRILSMLFCSVLLCDCSENWVPTVYLISKGYVSISVSSFFWIFGWLFGAAYRMCPVTSHMKHIPLNRRKIIFCGLCCRVIYLIFQLICTFDVENWVGMWLKTTGIPTLRHEMPLVSIMFNLWWCDDLVFGLGIFSLGTFSRRIKLFYSCIHT